jgi:hypothetical protein
MSLLKSIIVGLTVFLCIFYIFSTRHYYTYCTYAKIIDNYLVKEEFKEQYLMLCESTFKNYSNHSIMKYSIDILYYLFTKVELSPEENNRLKIYISNVNYYSMKLELKILKTVHLGLYSMILYFLIVVLPKKLIAIILFIINKLLFVIFLIFMAEAVLNLYMDINVDIIWLAKIIYGYLPINTIGVWLMSIFSIFK